MKYTIESTENGCMAILELGDGKKYVCETRKFCGYYEEPGSSIADQLEKAGFDEDIVERVDDMFGGMMESGFIDLSELVYLN